MGEKLVGFIETYDFNCPECMDLARNLERDDFSKPLPSVRTVHPPKVIGGYDTARFGRVVQWCLGGTKGKWIVYGGPEELDVWESLGEEQA